MYTSVMFFGDGLQCLQVYQAGVRNLDLTFIFKNVAWPVIAGLSLTIALPYVTFMGIVPLTGMITYIHTYIHTCWTYIHTYSEAAWSDSDLVCFPSWGNLLQKLLIYCNFLVQGPRNNVFSKNQCAGM